MLNKFDDVWNVFVIISRNGVVGYKDWETLCPDSKEEYFNISCHLLSIGCAVPVLDPRGIEANAEAACIMKLMREVYWMIERLDGECVRSELTSQETYESKFIRDKAIEYLEALGLIEIEMQRRHEIDFIRLVDRDWLVMPGVDD